MLDAIARVLGYVYLALGAVGLGLAIAVLVVGILVERSGPPYSRRRLGP